MDRNARLPVTTTRPKKREERIRSAWTYFGVRQRVLYRSKKTVRRLLMYAYAPQSSGPVIFVVLRFDVISETSTSRRLKCVVLFFFLSKTQRIEGINRTTFSSAFRHIVKTQLFTFRTSEQKRTGYRRSESTGKTRASTRRPIASR